MSTTGGGGVRRRRGAAKAGRSAGTEATQERAAVARDSDTATATYADSADSGYGSDGPPPQYESGDSDGGSGDVGAGAARGGDAAAGAPRGGSSDDAREDSGDGDVSDGSDGSDGDSDASTGERRPGGATAEAMARDVLAARALHEKSDDDSGLVDIVMGAVGFLFAFVIGTAIPVLTSVDHTILMTGGLCTLLVVVLVANFMPSKKPQQEGAAAQATAAAESSSHAVAMQVFTGAAGVGLMLGGLIGNVVSHVYHPRIQVWEVDSL